MLKFTDIINIEKENLSKYKIHFAIGVKDKKEPLYELYKKNFKSWQEKQSKKNFEKNYILSLIYYNPHEWIFGGIFERKGVKRVGNRYRYDTELLDIQKDLIGRLIIHYEKNYRQSYPNLERWYKELIVSEILKEPYTVERFPGYENVLIDFNLLKTIIKEEEPSWKSTLSSIIGVYLITDTNNGKLYVGSAHGDEAFWGRWSHYAKNGHGGNKELKRIIDEKGIDYASNFQFSILEIKSKKSKIAEDTEITERENFWKEILKSREFGYNEN